MRAKQEYLSVFNYKIKLIVEKVDYRGAIMFRNTYHANYSVIRYKIKQVLEKVH